MDETDFEMGVPSGRDKRSGQALEWESDIKEAMVDRSLYEGH